MWNRALTFTLISTLLLWMIAEGVTQKPTPKHAATTKKSGSLPAAKTPPAKGQTKAEGKNKGKDILPDPKEDLQEIYEDRPFPAFAGKSKIDCRKPDCVPPPEAGFCRGSIEAFFWNATSKLCEEFDWGGCDMGSNCNRFSSESGCKKACSKPEKLKKSAEEVVALEEDW